MSSDEIPRDSSGTPLPASLEGYFLISETELLDPNFYRTVVLIVSHNDEGAFGLVVNRPSDTTLGEIIPEYSDRPEGAAVPFVGGPVEQQYLFTVHGGPPGLALSEHAHSPAEGIIFEPSFHVIDDYFDSRPADHTETAKDQLQFYVGYSGWAPGQLEEEIATGAWLVIPAVPSIVFYPDPAEGWNAALRQKGGLYSIIAQTGFKPSLN
jgi:putative transcriptional regulator